MTLPAGKRAKPRIQLAEARSWPSAELHQAPSSPRWNPKRPKASRWLNEYDG